MRTGKSYEWLLSNRPFTKKRSTDQKTVYNKPLI